MYFSCTTGEISFPSSLFSLDSDIVQYSLHPRPDIRSIEVLVISKTAPMIRIRHQPHRFSPEPESRPLQGEPHKVRKHYIVC
jgi:hypothetical protein